MSISDAINNARQKINDAYNVIGLKGGSIPAEKTLENLPIAISGVSSQIFDWNFKGYSNGNIILDSYNGSYTGTVQVPNVGNYISVNSSTSSPFYNNKSVQSIDFNQVPFEGTSLYRSFFNSNNLKEVYNFKASQGFSQGVTNVTDLFRGCNSLVSVGKGSPASSYGVADVQVPITAFDASGIFADCTNTTFLTIGGMNVTSVNGALSNHKETFDVVIESPFITSATNFCNNFAVPSPGVNSAKCIWVHKTYIDGRDTQTYNTFKANSSYGLGTANLTTGFSLMDLGNPGLSYTTNTTARTVTFKSVSYSGLLPTSFRLYPPYPEYSVVAVENTCFKGSTKVAAVDFNSVPVVGNSLKSSFQNCYNLAGVFRINENVTDMTNTFDNCGGLGVASGVFSKITIPRSVEYMNGTFYNTSAYKVDIYSSNVKFAFNCFKNVDRTYHNPIVGIPYNYSNSDKRTATFNAFVNAGYLYSNGVSTNKHGAEIHDLNVQ